jgi:hypothetical protein
MALGSLSQRRAVRISRERCAHAELALGKQRASEPASQGLTDGPGGRRGPASRQGLRPMSNCVTDRWIWWKSEGKWHVGLPVQELPLTKADEENMGAEIAETRAPWGRVGQMLACGAMHGCAAPRPCRRGDAVRDVSVRCDASNGRE